MPVSFITTSIVERYYLQISLYKKKKTWIAYILKSTCCMRKPIAYLKSACQITDAIQVFIKMCPKISKKILINVSLSYGIKVVSHIFVPAVHLAQRVSIVFIPRSNRKALAWFEKGQPFDYFERNSSDSVFWVISTLGSLPISPTASIVSCWKQHPLKLLCENVHTMHLCCGWYTYLVLQ